MSRYEATFEIESKRDSYAVRRILEQAHDAVREESPHVQEDTDGAGDLLATFETLRDVAAQPSPGKLTITYEQYDEAFDD